MAPITRSRTTEPPEVASKVSFSTLPTEITQHIFELAISQSNRNRPKHVQTKTIKHTKENCATEKHLRKELKQAARLVRISHMTSREMIRTLGDLRAKISDKAEETKAKMIAQKATLVAKGAPLECDTFGTKSPCKCKTCWLQTLQDHQKMYAAYLKKFDRLQKLLKNQISRRRAKLRRLEKAKEAAVAAGKVQAATRESTHSYELRKRA